MRPRKISGIVRVGILSATVFVVLSGVGLSVGNGVVEAQRKGNGSGGGGGNGGGNPPTVQPNPPGMQPGMQGSLPSLDQPTIVTDPVRAHMEVERMKAMNDDRQKKLAADVDRLLALTNELKSSLDKTNKDELSVEVIRKAAEIEKLAHDVQSRMKN